MIFHKNKIGDKKNKNKFIEIKNAWLFRKL